MVFHFLNIAAGFIPNVIEIRFGRMIIRPYKSSMRLGGANNRQLFQPSDL